MKVRRHASGFTLLELMVAVAIVGILLAIALPSYTTYIQRTKTQEATGNLADARLKFEQFFQDNRTYAGYVDGSCVPVTAGVSAIITSPKAFTYTCTGTATTFTVRADGVPGENMNAYIYTINELNAKTSTMPGNALVNCWVSKPGEGC